MAAEYKFLHTSQRVSNEPLGSGAVGRGRLRKEKNPDHEQERGARAPGEVRALLSVSWSGSFD